MVGTVGVPAAWCLRFFVSITVLPHSIVKEKEAMTKGDKMRMSRKSNRKRVKALQQRIATLRAEQRYLIAKREHYSPVLTDGSDQ